MSWILLKLLHRFLNPLRFLSLCCKTNDVKRNVEHTWSQIFRNLITDISVKIRWRLTEFLENSKMGLKWKALHICYGKHWEVADLRNPYYQSWKASMIIISCYVRIGSLTMTVSHWWQWAFILGILWLQSHDKSTLPTEIRSADFSPLFFCIYFSG